MALLVARFGEVGQVLNIASYQGELLESRPAFDLGHGEQVPLKAGRVEVCLPSDLSAEANLDQKLSKAKAEAQS